MEFLPTHAGLVWTDGANALTTMTFEAFDRNGVPLGTVSGNHADGSITGTTGEDRFYGVSDPGGISRITIITGTGNAQELDHLQFGYAPPVPEPSAVMLGLLSVLGLIRRRSRS